MLSLIGCYQSSEDSTRLVKTQPCHVLRLTHLQVLKVQHKIWQHHRLCVRSLMRRELRK